MDENHVMSRMQAARGKQRMPNAPARKDHLAFLEELAANLREAQQRPGVSAEERGRYGRWIERAAALELLLESGGKGSSPAAARAAETELPPALLRELSSRKRDALEQQIVAVLAAGGGSADLDQVLIGLYRSFGVIAKRRVIQNKLWRLVRTGRICKAKDTRNVFSLEAAAKPRERRTKRRR
jgi:hypothetical protein